jgi:hypothetical protein
MHVNVGIVYITVLNNKNNINKFKNTKFLSFFENV